MKHVYGISFAYMISLCVLLYIGSLYPMGVEEEIRKCEHVNTMKVIGVRVDSGSVRYHVEIIDSIFITIPGMDPSPYNKGDRFFGIGANMLEFAPVVNSPTFIME